MRKIVKASPEESERMRRLQALVAEELPELMTKGQRLRDAAAEPTLSGELRRAVRASDLALTEIVRRSGVPLLDFDSFLTGDAPLPSDAIDRLAATLGCALRPTQPAS